MGKPLNLTGQVFGQLTVLEKSSKRISNRIAWHCKCSCGQEKDVLGSHLVSGHTQSCGCLQKQAASQLNPARDITGQRFGKLIALSKDSSRGKHTYWICQCDCGNICSIRTNSLTSNHTTSCGCISSSGEEKIADWLIAHSIPFTRQQTFDSCRNPETKCLLRFDFYINNTLLLEYDGITHYKSTQGWNTDEAVVNQQKRDNVKNQWCLNNHIPLYRISYDDIYSDEELNKKMQQIMEEINYGKEEY